jgi:hypothetical protein
MTKNQIKYVGLLYNLAEKYPEVKFYTDEGIVSQMQRVDDSSACSPGHSLKALSHGVVEEVHLLLPSAYSNDYSVVRAWGIAGSNSRVKWPGAGDGPILQNIRNLRDRQPGADFFSVESIEDPWGYLAFMQALMVVEVWWVVGRGGERTAVCDLTEPRTPRQALAHKLWRRPARDPRDRKYGTYTKAQFVKLLDWADAARTCPELFVVLTFGTTAVWFPKAGTYVANSGIVAGGLNFYVKESPAEVNAALAK